MNGVLDGADLGMNLFTSDQTSPARDPLRGATVLVVGTGSGIGAQLCDDLLARGATVVRAGRHPRDGEIHLDLTSEDSIGTAAHEVGEVDHVVNLAAATANGPLADLDPADVHRALDAKVVGPLMLAKHLRLRPGGSLVLFSGFVADRPQPGLSVMATVNGAVQHLAQALAVELAPLRVNAVSPGIVDSGSWDAMGDDKRSFLAERAAANPARRTGTPADLSRAVLSLLENPFITATTLHVDGGGRLA